MDPKDKIIKGSISAERILNSLAEKIAREKAISEKVPGLAIISVGNDPASEVYVGAKIKAASKIGIEASRIWFGEKVSREGLLDKIASLNLDPKISGIIVQLPLPDSIDKNEILSAIDPKKDVDGFHPTNVGLLHIGSREGFVPSTPLGIMELVKSREPDLSGKKVVIIGRSNIVGKPCGALFLRENATVTICHSKSLDLKSIVSGADIVISAMGSPKKLTAEYFSENSIIIDVGISRLPSGKLCGDVDFDSVFPKAKYITPVPGGVGPVTVAFLMKNTFYSFLSLTKI